MPPRVSWRRVRDALDGGTACSHRRDAQRGGWHTDAGARRRRHGSRCAHLLHPVVTFTGDSNRMAPTAARVIHGPDKVARFLFGLANRYGPEFLSSSQLAKVNGQLGSYLVGSPARRRLSGGDAARHGDDRARRKGLRHLGYRQSRQVHRFAAESAVAHGTRERPSLTLTAPVSRVTSIKRGALPTSPAVCGVKEFAECNDRAMPVHIVGRSGEERAIDEFLTSAHSEPSALVIEGEAGIGKSTLWWAGLDRARGNGFHVLAARAAQPETVHAFATIGDLLAEVESSYVTRIPDIATAGSRPSSDAGSR